MTLGLNPRRRKISLLQNVTIVSVGHPASYSVGTWNSFSRGKWPVREAVHVPHSSTEIKNEKRNTSLPLCAVIA